MEDYVIEKSESEGHFNFFDERRTIWTALKESGQFKQFLSKLEKQLEKIRNNVKKRADKEMYVQIEWTQFLTKQAQILCADKEHQCIHYCCITQTVGKYLYIYKTTDTQKPNAKNSSLTVSHQSDAGLLMLASGCLGKMFKLYRKNRTKYGLLLRPLAQMLCDKTKTKIPVEIAYRDKGGLYVILLSARSCPNTVLHWEHLK